MLLFFVAAVLFGHDVFIKVLQGDEESNPVSVSQPLGGIFGKVRKWMSYESLSNFN